MKTGHLKRAMLLCLLLIGGLAACQANEPEVKTCKEVVDALIEQGLPLKESGGVWGSHVFGMKLNKVRPDVYELEKKKLYLYIYPSSEAREKGLADWRDETATMDIVSHQLYETQNVLLFYVYKDAYMDEDIDRKIRAALDSE